MTSHRYRNLFRDVWHPTDREIFLYVNGELASKAAAKIHSHLEGCWPCGVKRDQWAESISAFMDYHRSVFGQNSAPPPDALNQFEAKLKGMTESEVSTRLWEALVPERSFGFRPKLATALGTFLLMLMSAVVLMQLGRWTSAPAVSANEVLQRIHRAEAQRLEGVSSPVVYQKLRVRRRLPPIGADGVVTWEIWNDAKNGRHRQRVDDAPEPRLMDSKKGSSTYPEAPVSAMIAELQQVLRDNHLDPQRPLSAAGYDAWRQSIQHRTEKVYGTTLPDGHSALTLATIPTGPVKANGVTTAELVVRADTWHPVEQRLAVASDEGIRNYEISETDFEVHASSSLGSSFFAETTLPSTPLRLPKEPQFVPVPSLSPAELISKEIETHYVLHRLKICLGEPVEVTSNPREGVTVRGLVPDANRKENVLRALQLLPHVTVHIQTVDEAVSSQQSTPENPTAQGELPTSSPAQARSGQSRIQSQLERYFAKDAPASPPESAQRPPTSLRERITEFSNRTASLTQSALAEAWALRRLAEWYHAERINRPPLSARLLLEDMVQDHEAALKEELAHWEVLLSPVLLTIAARPEPPASGETVLQDTGEQSDANWASESLRLFQLVQQMERLTLGLLGVEAQPESVEGAAQELLGAFGQVDVRLQAVARMLGKDRQEDPASPLANEASGERRPRLRVP